MGNPAARVGDMHVCPMATGNVPHNGGPVGPQGSPNVNIGNLPAARVSDSLTCNGPLDMIALGSNTVFINGLPAARLGDQTAHGGVITQGSPLVNIG
ncbi:putative Zn-binding protein involved in type VI secretion [Nitrosomonas nitrosa]|nr:putative Zn-binding protein involved in type VI secretion [Nitrosomonas nitrosa]